MLSPEVAYGWTVDTTPVLAISAFAFHQFQLPRNQVGGGKFLFCNQLQLK